MIRIDPTIWPLHYQPIFNRIQEPEVVVASQQIIAVLTKLLLLRTTIVGCHRRLAYFNGRPNGDFMAHSVVLNRRDVFYIEHRVNAFILQIRWMSKFST